MIAVLKMTGKAETVWGAASDERIRKIAEAVGEQIAREQFRMQHVANDNHLTIKGEEA